MADPKGDTLLVNVGASQARRRLKGFGHGVRKVQSAGRHRALIIHTATGQHLTELEAKFADVGYASSERELGESVDNLRHVGATAVGWLREAGIRTIPELEQLGAASSYRRIKQQHPAAPASLLWALAAGLAGKEPSALTADEKEALRAAFREGEMRSGVS